MEARAPTVIKRAFLSPQPSYRQGLGHLFGPGQTHKSKQPWGDGGPSQRHGAGTHMHVVDAVATYCSPVVTKVILNRWVPHLKCGKRRKKVTFQKQGRGSIRSPDVRVCRYGTTSLCHSRTGATIKNKDLSLSVLKHVLFFLWAVFLGKHVCPVRRYLYGFSALIWQIPNFHR